ncbi:hypothetical protein RSOLAG1IB_01497 [Rhizoctonia solani AG-1 IB]|uniref:Uncharacterized protein n=1 Tax=Thanatephorus cucumeris (strain AG1-IB / isolate 7/3/14) TaxID=1108050 RepID=A0A0B7FD03_THACB|nr:hypothetical protein RSOLAG1IB_01497 [Rhizoctonia solani AG-1 IB]
MATYSEDSDSSIPRPRGPPNGTVVRGALYYEVGTIVSVRRNDGEFRGTIVDCSRTRERYLVNYNDRHIDPEWVSESDIVDPEPA